MLRPYRKTDTCRLSVLLTYTLATAGFNVTNTNAESAGFSYFLEQHAEALRIRQTSKAMQLNITQTHATAAKNHILLQHLLRAAEHLVKHVHARLHSSSTCIALKVHFTVLKSIIRAENG